MGGLTGALSSAQRWVQLTRCTVTSTERGASCLLLGEAHGFLPGGLPGVNQRHAYPSSPSPLHPVAEEGNV